MSAIVARVAVRDVDATTGGLSGAELKVKLIFGAVISIFFWMSYFTIGREPVFEVHYIPATVIDRVIPFAPQAALIYVSEIITVPLVGFLLKKKFDISCFFRGLIFISVVSFLIFFFFPTEVHRPIIGTDTNYVYRLIALVDIPRNAFPSLHAALAIFSAFWAFEIFRDWKWKRTVIAAVGFYTAAVLASTLFTKQHLFWDLATGSFLGCAGYAVFRCKTGSIINRTHLIWWSLLVAATVYTVTSWYVTKN